MYLWWSWSTLPLLTRQASHCRQLGSLLGFCATSFQVLINSHVDSAQALWAALGPFQIKKFTQTVAPSLQSSQNSCACIDCQGGPRTSPNFSLKRARCQTHCEPRKRGNGSRTSSHHLHVLCFFPLPTSVMHKVPVRCTCSPAVHFVRISPCRDCAVYGKGHLCRESIIKF